ncbi:class I SAM-dependent methyltransferase [Sphingosinicella sp. CPCC 101087]|uniref:methyltransferase n=1 Tax=Sphingosinicella sp. CPCC 101087 TaxID=2497754 RepID=UPI00101C0C14|nr:class I SAM-dependent methyltransferase [Sphingosinicella sp. CPCC 101087]
MVSEEALLELLRWLDRRGYDFVTTTPRTHRRFVGAKRDRAESLRDVFGWSLPFSADIIDSDLLELLQAADALAVSGNDLRCRYRVSRVCGRLFLHSAYPTDEPDSVFLGPDTYRFIRFVLGRSPAPASRLIDMGTGTGAGGICAAPMVPNASIVLLDSNPKALRLARINAAAAGVDVEAIEACSFDALEGEFELVIANPPFIADVAGPTYRAGGAMLGAQVSIEWALAASARLAPGGRIFLYTGSAIVNGRDCLRETLERELPALGCTLRYQEIDPDIFGEQLEGAAYREVERIAAVGAVIRRNSATGG